MFCLPAQAASTDALPIGDSNEKSPSAFAPNYIFAEISRHAPVGLTDAERRVGPYHPVISWRHTFDAKWILGIGSQFRILRTRTETTETEEDYFSVFHETYRSVRLYHPHHILLGVRSHYMFPAKKATLPFRRSPDKRNDFSVGISAVYVRVLGGQNVFMVRFDRWRGTNTNELHGIEWSLGYGWSLN